MALELLIILGLITLLSALTLKISFQILTARNNRKKLAVAFFHPYTDGGGGERVLWCAVKVIQDLNPNLDCHVYTGDHDSSPESLAAHRSASNSSTLPWWCICTRGMDRGSNVPKVTMIGQSLGSVYLSFEALTKFTPAYYFDTSGYAFTYPMARLFGCKVICYTHYPTISLDMLSRVRQRSSMYNNDDYIVRSEWLSRCKIVYYNVFSWMYGIVGSCAHLVMVNSSWTQSHIQKIWKIPQGTKRVLPLERPSEPAKIISVAQFRPEKAHTLQLEAFAVALGKLDAHLPRPKLQSVGSCRNKSDEGRLEHLKSKAIELKVDGDVEFHKNVTYRDLVQLLARAIAGIHSMTDEHFGISVVEYMAAGAVPIAHNSAGPQMDIVLAEDREQTGFLARTVDEYADAILSVIKMPEADRLKMAAAARCRAARFSEQRFYEDFKAAVSPILPGTST